MRARKYFDGRLGQHSSNLIIALSLIVIISGTATTLLQGYLGLLNLTLSVVIGLLVGYLLVAEGFLAFLVFNEPTKIRLIGSACFGAAGTIIGLLLLGSVFILKNKNYSVIILFADGIVLLPASCTILIISLCYLYRNQRNPERNYNPAESYYRAHEFGIRMSGLKKSKQNSFQTQSRGENESLHSDYDLPLDDEMIGISDLQSSRRRANTYEMPAKISCPLNRSISENYPPNNYYDEDPLSNRNSVITDFNVDDLSLDNCKNVNSEDEENLTSQSDEKLDDQSFDNFYSCEDDEQSSEIEVKSSHHHSSELIQNQSKSPQNNRQENRRPQSVP